jgi:hypothetical protein
MKKTLDVLSVVCKHLIPLLKYDPERQRRLAIEMDKLQTTQ